MSTPETATNDVSTISDWDLVWLRLEQKFPFVAQDAAEKTHRTAWLVLLGVIGLIGLIYVIIYYLKEMKSTGWNAWFSANVLGILGKGNPLGLVNSFRFPGGWLMLMRSAVYVMLGFVFLLPAWRITTTEKRPPTVRKSKVIVIWDVSDSVTQLRDELPQPGQTLLDVPVRQDKIMEKLVVRDDFAFLKDVSKENPAYLYRFAHSLDPEYRYFDKGKFWPREMWEDRSRLMLDAERKKEKGEDVELPDQVVNGFSLEKEDWERWLYPKRASTLDPNWIKENPDELEIPELWRRKLVQNNVTLLARNFTRATSLEQVVLQTLRRERGNLVEGIIIVSDGKTVSQNQDESEESARRVAQKSAQKLSEDLGIPIFVVGVGKNRRTVSTTIADLRAPGQIQPEDKFPVEFGIEGIGREGEEFPVSLELVRGQAKEAADGKEIFEQKDIILEPLGESGEVLKDVPSLNLGKWLTLRPTFRLNEGTVDKPFVVPVFNQRTNEGPTPIKEKPKFLKGSPPSAQISLQITTKLLAQKLINEADPKARRDELEAQAKKFREDAASEGDEAAKKLLLEQADHLDILAKDVGSITRGLIQEQSRLVKESALKTQDDTLKQKRNKLAKDLENLASSVGQLTTAELSPQIEALSNAMNDIGLSEKEVAKLMELKATLKDIEVKSAKVRAEYRPAQKYGIQHDDNMTLRFRVRVPKDKRELDVVADHRSLPADVLVLKKPVRVLLFASVATREYRFLRTLFVRESEKKRASVCIHIQPIPGTEPRTGLQQDVPKERLLKYFPQQRKKPDGVGEVEGFNYLDQYDVIIAFDPDWRYLADNPENLPLGGEAYKRRNFEVLENIREWISKDGGGLIMLPGKMNMVYLNDPSIFKDKFFRPNPKTEKDEEHYFLEPIHSFLPVTVDYDALTDSDWREPTKPHMLELGALSPEWEFMRLEEDKPDVDVREAWKKFFLEQELNDGSKKMIDPTKEQLERGFYSYIPIQEVKKGKTNVVARFMDPDHKVTNEAGREEFQPYIVLREYDKGRVAWLGSGEMWRLRTYNEKFHERFWTKLARYTGTGSHGAKSKTIIPVLSRYGKLRVKSTLEAQFENKDGDPLVLNPNEDDVPLLHVTMPSGKAIEVNDFVLLRDEVGSRLNGKAGKVLKVYRKDKQEWIDVELVPDNEADKNNPDFKRDVASIESLKATVFIPTLKFEPQKDKGWYAVKFEPVVAGRHVLELENPKTGEKYRHVFFVQDPNPELLYRAPALDQAFYLASKSSLGLLTPEGTPRIADEAKRKAAELALRKPDFGAIDAESDGPSRDEIEMRKTERLYFDLDSAKEIPSYITKNQIEDPNDSERVKDDPIWDRGFVVFWEETSWGGYPRFEDTSPREDPDSISYFLVGVVMLLSMEWLARKLLRLA